MPFEMDVLECLKSTQLARSIGIEKITRRNLLNVSVEQFEAYPNNLISYSKIGNDSMCGYWSSREPLPLASLVKQNIRTFAFIHSYLRLVMCLFFFERCDCWEPRWHNYSFKILPTIFMHSANPRARFFSALPISRHSQSICSVSIVCLEAALH